MISPFSLPPHPLAQAAAAEVVERVHTYMRAHPESELHTQGKMFGVLVYAQDGAYIAAFSAQLDGLYNHEGFVPPVYDITTPPVGKNKEESQRLQQLLFANYRFTNGYGETRDLLDIFANEKPIIPAEEWFGNKTPKAERAKTNLPPAGAGECCAPKLLQYALTHGMKPVEMAEFWIGAPSRTEVRHEGCFYPPCSGKCVPILRHMLRGIDVEPVAKTQEAETLCRLTEILYEDEYLIVADKPAGLLSVPGKSDIPSLSAFLSAERGGVPVMAAHRLDQDTSGLLVLAKTEEAYKQLQTCFQRRDILKRYEAVLTSEPPQKEGLIDLPLLPNPYDRPRQMVDKAHGKPSLTRYEVIEYYIDGSVRINLYPLTGRTHQLRVHAAHSEGLNAPIAGDRLYGRTNTPGQPARLMLHAAEIAFPHPVSKQEMHFCSKAPF